MDFAKTRPEHLDAGFVDWRFLAVEESVFARMRSSIRHLKTLSLDLFSDSYDVDSQLDVECYGYLEKGRLREFLAAAQDLTELVVKFDDHTLIGEALPQLGHIVCEFTWANLESVGLHCIQTSEENLLQFFERHAGTLSRVALETITLSTGAWTSTLQRMRRTVTLKDFDFNGDLRCSTGSTDHWTTDHWKTLDFSQMWEPKEDCLRKALRRYFLEEDRVCPLLDYKSIVGLE